MQFCPICKADNPDMISHCIRCNNPLRQLLGRGEVLQNRYRIDDLLGCGGFGAVYKAVDMHLGIIVAIKENLEFSTTKQFLTEAKLLANLSHPSLPRVYDYFTQNGKQYLVMEYIEGKTLDEIVKEKGRLNEEEVLNLFKDIFDAVSYLHSQNPPIIHRDIKPQNIIITPQGRAVLVDFGIAKIGGLGKLTSTIGRQFGSVGFAPLEQYEGRGMTDERTDIYALGATLYFSLTGQIPLDAVERAHRLITGQKDMEPIHQFNDTVSIQFEMAIEKALAISQDQRFTNVNEFWQALNDKSSINLLPSLFHQSQKVSILSAFEGAILGSIGGTIFCGVIGGIFGAIIGTIGGAIAGMLLGALAGFIGGGFFGLIIGLFIGEVIIKNRVY